MLKEYLPLPCPVLYYSFIPFADKEPCFAQINSLEHPSSFHDGGGGRRASLQLSTYKHGFAIQGGDGF